MINYEKILNKNLTNVLKDILNIIKDNSTADPQLYITINTRKNSVIIPEWVNKKYPGNITIVIEHEFENLKVDDDFFSLTLSFNNIKTNIVVGFDAIISFADPSKNFGLQLINKNLKDTKKVIKRNDNIIEFPKTKN